MFNRPGEMKLNRTMGPVRSAGLVIRLILVTPECAGLPSGGRKGSDEGGSLALGYEAGTVEGFGQVAQSLDMFSSGQSG